MNLFLTSLLTLLSSTLCVQLLEVSTNLFHQRLAHGESSVYQMNDLIKGQVYEFKVSYPATMPFDFTLTFAKSHPVLGESIPQRKLLDIEKEEFTGDGGILYVQVTAHDNQRSIAPSPFVQYSVIYEPVYNGMPAQAQKLIGVLVIAVPIAFVMGHLLFVKVFNYHDHSS